MKAMMKKAHRVESIGHGTIGPDGALTLVQQVRDEGEAPHQRNLAHPSGRTHEVRRHDVGSERPIDDRSGR